MALIRTILHLDMDAFFASVEQRDHPDGNSRKRGRRPLAFRWRQSFTQVFRQIDYYFFGAKTRGRQ